MIDNKKQLVDFADMSLDDKHKLVRDCKTLKQSAAALRYAFETHLVQNAAFLAGDQYASWVTDAQRYTNNRRIPVYAPGTKIQVIANKILGICWQQASYLNQNFNEETAQAPDSSKESMLRAEIATDILRARFKQNNEEERRIFDLFWLFVAGRVWRMPHWDADASYPGFDGQDVAGAGDCKSPTISPFKVYQSPWVDSTGEMPWLILSDVLSKSQVQGMFPEHADKIEEIEVAESTAQMDSLLQSVVQGAAMPAKRKNATILDRLYHRPTKDYPEGSVITWCGDVLLDRQSLPESKWCFQHIDWTPIPGANYPLAYIEPMIGPQRQLNFTLSQVRELARRQLSGDIAYKGSRPDAQLQFKPTESFTDDNTGSKMIRIDPAVQEWQFITYDLNANLGQNVIEMMGDIMLDVGSIHDQSMGKQQSANITATTTLALKESDSAGTSLHRDIISRAYCRVREIELNVIANHVIVPRQIHPPAKNGAASDPVLVVGSDIQGITEVSVRPSPMMTDAQRRETLDRMESMNMFGPFPFDMSDPRYWVSMLKGAEDAMNSGMPNIEAYVENRIAPFSIEGLRSFVADLHKSAVEMIMNPPQAQQPGIQQAALGGAPMQDQQMPIPGVVQ
jgi:hypothetical protein